MKLNERKILTPNSEFERREELLRMLTQSIEPSKEDIAVLNLCTAEDHETIGMIGCILKNNSDLNKARLLIASLNLSNIDLVNRANTILNLSEIELNKLIDKFANKFLSNSDGVSIYEDKIYSILFGILSNRA